MTLEELYTIIEDRKKKMPKDSYIASLFQQGYDRIVQKVGEEAVEVVIASKNKEKKKTISEVADLLFHLLVLLSAQNIKLDEVLEELGKRSAGQKTTQQ